MKKDTKLIVTVAAVLTILKIFGIVSVPWLWIIGVLFIPVIYRGLVKFYSWITRSKE